MSAWLDGLRDSLRARAGRGLARSLVPVRRADRIVERGGRRLVNFASNDYLALSGHPRLVRAVADAAERYGVGAGASRLITGHLEPHERVERRFAEFKCAAAALLCPTGYMANLAVLGALAGRGDAVLLDKLCHASLIDAARASGATVRTFAHRDLGRLGRLLVRYAAARRRFIVTDSVFSMDGDCADLPGLCEVRDRYGAVLIVDEAHATGILGAGGSGLAEHQGVAGRVDVTVSTASKALGSLGGVVTAHRVVIDTLVNHARPFIYTTGLPPVQAAAIEAALDVVRDEPRRRARLAALARMLREGLRGTGWPVAEQVPGGAPTPIVPVVVGDAGAAVKRSRRLEAAGYLVPAVRPPTVAPGTARLRFSVRADMTEQDVTGAVAALGKPG